MMKTLCVVVVVVLSLTSVCQPASLACQKLLKPLDKGPDLSGRWHYIAVSSDVCLVTTLLSAVLWPSVVVDIASTGLPSVYNANIKIKMYGYCLNESQPFFQNNNAVFDVDSDYVQSGEPDVLLQSGCPDCIIVKGDEDIKFLMLFSRRQTVTAAELKEFETQTECLGWSKPQVLNSDHDYVDCKQTEDNISDADRMAIFSMMLERVESVRETIVSCIVQFFLSYLPALYFEK